MKIIDVVIFLITLKFTINNVKVNYVLYLFVNELLKKIEIRGERGETHDNEINKINNNQKNVNQDYSEDTYIFEESTEKRSHPYGWEYIDEYNENPDQLMQDIKNGNFEEFLTDEVSRILNEINQNKLIM